MRPFNGVTSSDCVVYVVDDDSRLRESMSDLLASYSLEVVTFATAQEYLMYSRPDRPACLVLDLGLPDINGLDLQQRLTEDTAPPIIFVTGNADVPSSVRAMKAGALEFLIKPVNPDVLVATIEVALEHNRHSRKSNVRAAVLRDRYGRLTPRERDVLPVVLSGLRNKQAAWTLGIAEVTLQVHRSQIMRKMAARSFAELVRMGLALGIEEPEPEKL